MIGQSSLREFAGPPSEASVDLYWLPLGAGGHFVRLNGRIYEAIQACLERRRPLDLYHSALEVHVPEGRFVIENAWPIPDADGASRGVVVEGAVGSRLIARLRLLRYEVRRWQDGVIPDANEAVASPQRLSDEPHLARRLLGLVGSMPALVWGRDELGTGEMWNSNSVIAWLLARSGLPVDDIRPPVGGRAPGWKAGVVVARLGQRNQERAPRMIKPPGPAGRSRLFHEERLAEIGAPDAHPAAPPATDARSLAGSGRAALASREDLTWLGPGRQGAETLRVLVRVRTLSRATYVPQKLYKGVGAHGNAANRFRPLTWAFLDRRW